MGKPESLPAAVTGDDLAVQDEASAQRGARPLEVAGRERIADRRRRDPRAVHIDELHALRGEPERRAQLRQVVDRAGGAVAEREVPSHHRMHPVHAVHEDALHEPFRGDLRELLGERQHDQLVDARGLDQRCAPFDGRQQPGFAAGRQDLTGMPVERHRDRADTALVRRLHRSREHRSMPQMHTVEEPDGDHRRSFRQRESLDPFDDPHAGQRIGNLSACEPHADERGRSDTVEPWVELGRARRWSCSCACR